jgi:inositol hexakisphosphate/diphosphoinositol-pentakisphosphate kinase
VSRQLASVVVPHEYGLDGPGKLLIGSKICAELLGKLLCDLDSMKAQVQAYHWCCCAFGVTA